MLLAIQAKFQIFRKLHKLSAHKQEVTHSVNKGLIKMPLETKRKMIKTLTTQQLNHFSRTAKTSRLGATISNAAPSMTVQRRKAYDQFSNPKRLDILQKEIYTPLKNRKCEPLSSINYTNDEKVVQPKILKLTIDDAEKLNFYVQKGASWQPGHQSLKISQLQKSFMIGSLQFFINQNSCLDISLGCSKCDQICRVCPLKTLNLQLQNMT